jgi:hypothetical protein
MPDAFSNVLQFCIGVLIAENLNPINQSYKKYLQYFSLSKVLAKICLACMALIKSACVLCRVLSFYCPSKDVRIREVFQEG